MKLVIQIPCYNEEETLVQTLADIPRSIPGISAVELLVIDDGSTDRTVEVAQSLGVDHIVRLPRNLGLARAFKAGLDASLRAGADVIVNTDGDNQYRGEDIPKLIAPILAGEAEMVVGARPIREIEHFSPAKKVLQRLGSQVVRWASRTSVPDAPSGFRAITRRAAGMIHVFSDYTYTLETVIQAGQKGMAVASVPIRVNRQARPSRLIKSIPSYLRRSALTIVRIFMTYRPFRFFAVPGIVSLIAGFFIGVRFLYFFATGQGGGHVQSLLLGVLLLGVGFFLVVVGLVTDLIAVNRKLLEEIDYRVRELGDKVDSVEHVPPARWESLPRSADQRGL
ncbi:MAG TPA: glycosyltransferase family 2 protein [Thermoanaerobaculia bacterium]|nr:glycosyltransferase family 2 protein [Thermoanaerobaculia bacterium]